MSWKTIAVSLAVVASALPLGLVGLTVASEPNSLTEAAIQAGQKSRATLKERLASLDNLADFTKEYQSQFHRELFDIQANLDALDYDAAQIIEFAKGSISYESYAGVLRGPLGTLMSRSGNSIDQSLFLAKTLRDAGYDARIAEGALSIEQAKMLLREMKRPRPATLKQADEDGLLKVIQNYNPKNTSSEVQAQTEAAGQLAESPSISNYQRELSMVQETSKLLQDTIGSKNLAFDSATATQQMINEARRYHWVQYRDTVAGSWVDVHPAFVGELPFNQPEATAYIAKVVPESLQHRFRFQVFLERSVGRKLEVVPLGSPWERPVANLVGVPLTFYNVPNTLPGPDQGPVQLDKVISDSTTFLPIFGTELVGGGQHFDLRGNLIDPMVASDQAAGIFKQVGEGFTDAVSGVGGESRLPSLTAQWIEFTLIDPSDEAITFQRTIFDRIGTANRNAGIVPEDFAPTAGKDAQSLLQRLSFMLHVGGVPKAFAVNRGSEYFLETLPFMRQEVMMRSGEKTENATAPNASPQWAGHSHLFSLFGLSDTLSDTHRVYRSAPALVVHRSGLDDDGKAFEAVDIVKNPIRGVDIGSDDVVVDSNAAMKAGLWETAVEGMLLTGCATNKNTWSAFEAAREKNVPITVLDSKIDPAESRLSPDTIAAINSDLEKGFWVIVPDTEPGPTESGWWRIHPLSGETVGQFGDGQGVSITEYLVSEQAAAVYSLAALGVGMAGCQQSSDTVGAWQCCAGINLTMYVLGFHAISTVAGMAWDAAGLVIPVTNVCSLLN